MNADSEHCHYETEALMPPALRNSITTDKYMVQNAQGPETHYSCDFGSSI